MLNLLQKQLAWLRGSNAKRLLSSEIGPDYLAAYMPGSRRFSIRDTGITGDLDIYTCPPGKKAIFVSWHRNNPTGGAISSFTSIGSGSNFIAQAAAASFGAGVASGAAGPICALMEEGDILRITDTAPGLKHTVVICETPATAIPNVRALSNFNVTNTAAKLYEAPAGKSGMFSGHSSYAGTSAPSVYYQNATGTGAKTCSTYCVPPAGSPAAEFLIQAVSVNDGAGGNVTLYVPAVMPGWSVWVQQSSNDAGVYCRAVVAERDV